jgi:hypothetical protein
MQWELDEDNLGRRWAQTMFMLGEGWLIKGPQGESLAE